MDGRGNYLTEKERTERKTEMTFGYLKFTYRHHFHLHSITTSYSPAPLLFQIPLSWRERREGWREGRRDGRREGGREAGREGGKTK